VTVTFTSEGETQQGVLKVGLQNMEVDLCAFASRQMKEKQEGDEQAVLGSGAEMTQAPREEGWLGNGKCFW